MSETTKRSKIDVARDAVRGIYDAHKEAFTIKNAGAAIGLVAGKVAIVGVKFYDGLYMGFHQKERPTKEV